MRLPFSRPAKPAADRPRAAAGTDEQPAVAAARTRARQRLVGALVLLVIGVIGFPILFETQPRPLPLDTPIVLARAEAPAVDPKPQAAARAAPVAPPVLPPADAGVEAVAASAPGGATATPQDTATPQAAAVPGVPTLPTAAATAAGEPASAPRTPRFVVQVGAFTDAKTLGAARQRVEKLGFKTYTQVIEGDAGKRTRVRVGPFATRDEAEAASAKLKGAGLAPNVLVL